MANLIYTHAKEGFLDGSINYLLDPIKAVLIDTAEYTVDDATDTFLSNIPGAARIATSAELTGKTVTDGVADAADPTFTSVSGPEIGAVVLYKDTGSASTSRLIAYIDTGTSLPFTPNGGNVIVSWSDGSGKIFGL